MAKSSMIEKLALPMFISGVLAMMASASVSLSATANASSPVQYRKVTLNYLSSGYSASDSNCGSYQDIYSSSSWSSPSFRAKSPSRSNSEEQFVCSVTLFVVSDVKIPTPKPVPTVTVIYRPEPTERPTVRPTPTQKPSISPKPRPTWWNQPTPTPNKTPRP